MLILLFGCRALFQITSDKIKIIECEVCLLEGNNPTIWFLVASNTIFYSYLSNNTVSTLLYLLLLIRKGGAIWRGVLVWLSARGSSLQLGFC